MINDTIKENKGIKKKEKKMIIIIIIIKKKDKNEKKQKEKSENTEREGVQRDFYFLFFLFFTFRQKTSRFSSGLKAKLIHAAKVSRGY